MRLIDAEALRDILTADVYATDDSEQQWIDGVEDARFRLDAAPTITCATCRYLSFGGETSVHWYSCSRGGCPADGQSVDQERFGCVCHEVRDAGA